MVLTNGHVQDNLGLVIHGAKDMRLEQVPVKNELSPDEVLVKAHSIGICGTDLHLYEDGYMSDFIIKEPMVIGHEVSGTVVEVGENVKHLKTDDKVTVEPAIPCYTCQYCRNGTYNLCPISNTQARGLPPKAGCIRRYFDHPANLVYKLPENVSLEEGAMCEPFAVVVHGCKRAGIIPGQNVLVCGAGTMGIMSAVCAKAFGAAKVYITDISESRLKLATSMGVDKAYLIDPNNFDANAVANRIKQDMQCEPDVTLECTGVETSIQLAVYATKNGGKVGLVGLGPLLVKAPLVYAALREIDLIGVCRFRDDFPLAIHLMETGKVNLKPLITHRFPVEKSLDAFNALKNPKINTLKVMIQFDQSIN